MTLIVVSLMLWLLPETVAGAEPRIARVGILVPELGRSQGQAIKGLRDELKALGYQEGKSIALIMRNAAGDRNALQPAARELVAQTVDALFTTGTRATQLAKAATADIPIVFVHPADPVPLGLVKDLHRPDGNVTGVAGFALQTTDRRLELSKAIVPRLQRVLIFYDSNNKASRENVEFAKVAAARSGLRVSELGIKSVDELKATIAGVRKTDGEAIFYVPDDLVDSEGEFLLDTARQKKLPTVFDGEGWAVKGALAAYGPSFYAMGRQAARLLQGVLLGQKPETLPVQRANKFDLVLNYRTATFVGITFSAEMLKKADRVIR